MDVTMFEKLLAEPRWFTIIGLIFDSFGAFLIALGVYKSRRQIIRDMVEESRALMINGHTPESAEETPTFRDRFFQSRVAVCGSILLLIGFALQIIGAWLQ